MRIVPLAHLGYEVVLREFARTILGAAPVFCGIAVVEDQASSDCGHRSNPAGEHRSRREQAFQKAESLLARLPFEEIDLLDRDRMGKTSAALVWTQRDRPRHSRVTSSLHSAGPVPHRVSRIFVATDPGQQWQRYRNRWADFTTARFVKARQSAIHVHECAYLARHARRENSHLL